MIRRKKVFIPNKKVSHGRSNYFNKQKARLKRFRFIYNVYLRRKFFKIKSLNKRFLRKKIRFLRYCYFIFNFIRQKIFNKFRTSRFLRKFNTNYISFRSRRRFFSNFFFYKKFDVKAFRIFIKRGFRNRLSQKRRKFLLKRFGLRVKFKKFSFNKLRGVHANRSKFAPKKRLPFYKNFNKKKRKFFKKFFLKSKRKYRFSTKKNFYSSFRANPKLFKRFNRRYEKVFFRFIYFNKFKRKLFRRTYNHKFWRRFFVTRFTRYFLSSKFRFLFKSKFNIFCTTYFFKRKKFFPYSFFSRSFSKFFFKNKFLIKKFKRKLTSVYPYRKRSSFFNYKFLFSGRKIFNRSPLFKASNNFVFFKSIFFKNFRRSWFFHSRAFKYNRYIDFSRFFKLNYFKKFIFSNKKKFKFIYSNLLSFSKFFRSFKRFKFEFFFKKKPFYNRKFLKFIGFQHIFKKRSPFYFTFLNEAPDSNIFSRFIFIRIFRHFYGKGVVTSAFKNRHVFANKFKKFKFFALKKFFYRKNKSFFGFRKNNIKYWNKKKFKKFKRKFNKKVNIVKFSRFFTFNKRKKSYFYKFFRRVSLFFKRRSSNPFPFRSRSNFNKNTFILNHFFFSNFLSRNLFYYNSGKFFRQFYFFKRRHKLYCSAFSARFRKLYRLRNRFKRKRKKFLRKIRFNFFISNFHAKRNSDSFNKEKNFVSLFHTKNNFFIYVHNVNGKIIHQSTNGMVGYRGPKKPTAFAAEMNARRVAKAIKYSKIFPIVLVIRTRLSSFVRSAIRGMNYIGVKFSYVKRIILKGHNGLRKPGLRRT